MGLTRGIVSRSYRKKPSRPAVSHTLDRLKGAELPPRVFRSVLIQPNPEMVLKTVDCNQSEIRENQFLQSPVGLAWVPRDHSAHRAQTTAGCHDQLGRRSQVFSTVESFAEADARGLFRRLGATGVRRAQHGSHAYRAQ